MDSKDMEKIVSRNIQIRNLMWNLDFIFQNTDTLSRAIYKKPETNKLLFKMLQDDARNLRNCCALLFNAAKEINDMLNPMDEEKQ